jgi:hypothetical protein
MPRRIKRTNAPGTCLYCGARLVPWPYASGAGGDGYRGQGHFCTLSCGWCFGLVVARDGRRLTPHREE